MAYSGSGLKSGVAFRSVSTVRGLLFAMPISAALWVGILSTIAVMH